MSSVQTSPSPHSPLSGVPLQTPAAQTSPVVHPTASLQTEVLLVYSQTPALQTSSVQELRSSQSLLQSLNQSPSCSISEGSTAGLFPSSQSLFFSSHSSGAPG